VVAALVLLLVTAVLVIALGGSSHRRTQVSDLRLSTARAEQLGSELRSGTESSVADAVALPSAARLLPAALRQLASLRSVTFAFGSFRDHHDGTGTIQATVVDQSGASTAWNVTLVVRGGEWRIDDSSFGGRQ